MPKLSMMLLSVVSLIESGYTVSTEVLKMAKITPYKVVEPEKRRTCQNIVILC